MQVDATPLEWEGQLMQDTKGVMRALRERQKEVPRSEWEGKRKHGVYAK